MEWHREQNIYILKIIHFIVDFRQKLTTHSYIKRNLKND